MNSRTEPPSRVAKRTPRSADSSGHSPESTVGGIAPAPYPTELEHVAVLDGGARVFVRPIRPDDESGLVDLYSRLSEHTAYQRFFTLMRRLPSTWSHFFANVDYRRRLALVAVHHGSSGPELIGVGRYESTDEERVAEIALVVQDRWQGRGLGTVLLDDIVRAAGARGVRRFRAFVLADNSRMLRLLSKCTEIVERGIEDGVVSVVFSAWREDMPRAATAPGS
jgi:RimJ/RimL family protein N-acetyltransferase